MNKIHMKTPTVWLSLIKESYLFPIACYFQFSLFSKTKQTWGGFWYAWYFAWLLTWFYQPILSMLGEMIFKSPPMIWLRSIQNPLSPKKCKFKMKYMRKEWNLTSRGKNNSLKILQGMIWKINLCLENKFRLGARFCLCIRI